MPTQPPSGSSDVVATMVPYKNMPALIGYYLAVWVAIVLGGLTTFAWVGLFASGIVAGLAHRQ